MDTDENRRKEHRMWCAREVERFSCLPFRPNDAGLIEILNALAQATVSDAHATATVNELLGARLDARGPRWPVPYEIVQAANGTRPEPEPEKMVKTEIACHKCRDVGNVRIADKYKRCDCSIGQDFPEELLSTLNRPRKQRNKIGRTPLVLALEPEPQNPQPVHEITQADIDAALEKHRQAKAAKAQPSEPIRPEAA